MGEKMDSGCTVQAGDLGCCRVESLVSIDERGQMVLPKDIREKAKIGAGDKLAVVTWEKEGKVCCISLIKSDEFAGMVRELLGPMMGAIAGDNNT
jgi:AbrB family looped-hinge helix DNA binding protein